MKNLLKIVTLNEFSVHIHLVSDYGSDYRHKSEEEQIRYICDCFKKNATIYSLAHTGSVLSDMLVRKHLNNDGFIIEGTYTETIGDTEVTFELSMDRIDKDKIRKDEQDYLKSIDLKDLIPTIAFDKDGFIIYN